MERKGEKVRGTLEMGQSDNGYEPDESGRGKARIERQNPHITSYPAHPSRKNGTFRRFS